MLYLRPLIGLLFIILTVHSYAQEFGGNPPAQRFRQIDTDTVRVIFPLGLEHQAQRVANTIHYLNRNALATIGERSSKLDVVLQNQTVIPNGYVGLAPFRSEFFLTAPQNPYAIGSNWLDVLSIHEYRHALQYSNARRGLTNVVYWLTGEVGWSLMMNMSIPDWFSEGDAVAYETGLTGQGRGRIPAFYNTYKSLLLHDVTYPYVKARNGSFKDLVPDHYELGYLLTQYGRERYRPDFWKGVLRDAGRYSMPLYPFSSALRQRTGVGTAGFYRQAMQYYDSLWTHTTAALTPQPAQQITPAGDARTVSFYRHPYYLHNGSLITYKRSYKKIGGFYHVDIQGRESLITNRGLSLEEYYTLTDSTLAWTEVQYNPRWGWKDYSDIVLYDMAKGERTRLTSRSKYFSPEIAHNGDMIVAFHTSPALQHALHILDARDGSLLRALPNPDNLFFSRPRWSADDNTIYVAARDSIGRMALLAVDAATGMMDAITPFTQHVIEAPFVQGDHVFFTASYGGMDDVYAVQPGQAEVYKITSRATGAYDPALSPSGQALIYSTIGPTGQRLEQIELNASTWTTVTPRALQSEEAQQPLSSMEPQGNIIGRIDNRTFDTKKYPLSKGLLNIHSWSAFVEDPNYELALQSQNVLNTLAMQVGARYNRNDDDVTYFFNADYAQYFPVLSFSAHFAPRSQQISIPLENRPAASARLTWQEWQIRPGVAVPLNLSRGLYLRSMQLATHFSYTSVTNQRLRDVSVEGLELNPEALESFGYPSLDHQVFFRNARLKALQNIFSPFGQFIQMRYRHSIDGRQNRQWYADSEFSLPGLAANHNVVIQGSYQQVERNEGYTFGDNFMYARGYDPPRLNGQQRYDKIYKLGFNYHLPITYPDFGVAGIIYLYRIRANAFFDYSRAHFPVGDSQFRSMYNSTGGELIFDTNIFNELPITFGFRYSYLMNENDVSPRDHLFEFFIPLQRL
jgi:hypothetical protein